jgi:serine/threonine protein kinase
VELFAFGAVLFEMIAGRLAFDRPNGARIIAAILERTPPAPSDLRADVPPALDRVVARCLAKKPDERWQTAHDLLSELKWIAEPTQPTAAAVLSRWGPRSRACLWFGMRDEAFTQLRRGCLEHSAYLDYLNVEPHLDLLRTDPRFADLLRCVRLSVDVSPVKVAVRAHPAS